MHFSPKVLICLPNLNNSTTLKDTLESLLQQTYKNYQIIIFDNNSDYETKKILYKYKKENKKIKVIFFRKTVKMEDSYNRCINFAKKNRSDFFAIFHTDDIYDRDIIKEQVHFFQYRSDISAISTGAYLINNHNKIIGSSRFLPELQNNIYNVLDKNKIINLLFKYNNFLFAPSFIFRTKFFKKKKLYFNYKKYSSAADIGLIYNISKYSNIGFLSKRLLYYRLSLNSYSYRKFYKRIKDSDFFLLLNNILKTFGKADNFLVKRLEHEKNFILMQDRSRTSINSLINGLVIKKKIHIIMNINQGVNSYYNFKKFLFSFFIFFILKIPFIKFLIIFYIKFIRRY